jgi:hypothetical protein
MAVVVHYFFFLEPIRQMPIPSSLLRIYLHLLFSVGHLRSHQVSASLLDNEAYLVACSREHSRIDVDNKHLKKSK